MKFGRAEEEWLTLTDDSHEFLIDCARRRRLTTYGELSQELAGRTGLARLEISQPVDRVAMSHLLFRLVDRSWQETELMLSALVAHGDANGAGPRFYSLAADLGVLPRNADRDQREAFWMNQVEKIYDHYAAEPA